MIDVNEIADQTYLSKIVKTVIYRLRWQETIRLSLLAIGSGLTVTLGLLLISRFYPLAFPLNLVLLGGVITFWLWLIVITYAWFRSYSSQMIARLIDEHGQLDDRLSTALELSSANSSISDNIISAQITDTIYHLKQFKIKEAFPFQLIWPRWMIVILLIMAIGLLLLLPNPQVVILQQQQQTQAMLDSQVAQLEEVYTELQENPELLATEDGELLVESLETLIETLKQDMISPEEALAAISEAEQTIAALQDNADAESTLNDVAETFSQFESTAELAEAIKERDATKAAELLDKATDEFTLAPETIQEMAQALQQAADQARLAGDEALADALQQAAETMRQAAENGDMQQMQEALDQAGQALNQAMGSGDPTMQEALEQALGNIQQAKEQLAQQQGEGQNQGQMMSQQPGSGSQGGAGRGDPDEGADGLFSDKPAPNQMSTDNGPNENKLEDYESLAIPEHLGGSGGPVVDPDGQDAFGGVPVGEAQINPDSDNSSAIVPYNEVYQEYSETANETLDNSYIPLGMKGYVREYFGALEPNSGGEN